VDVPGGAWSGIGSTAAEWDVVDELQPANGSRPAAERDLAPTGLEPPDYLYAGGAWGPGWDETAAAAELAALAAPGDDEPDGSWMSPLSDPIMPAPADIEFDRLGCPPSCGSSVLERPPCAPRRGSAGPAGWAAPSPSQSMDWSALAYAFGDVPPPRQFATGDYVAAAAPPPTLCEAAWHSP
jgi:hypothetical protein